MKVLTGVQPSGDLHIGNYFGSIKPMIDAQNEHEVFLFVANYHAQTSIADGSVLSKNVFQVLVDFLALGIDPQKTTFWVQSDVSEVLELYWILSQHTSMGLLQRAHSYKDKVAKGIAANHGLFAYPVLMAADILLFDADKVPVGKDQIQHIEMTRDIAMRFNQSLQDGGASACLKIPDFQVDEKVAVVPGLDGQKMSKSYGNTIPIFTDPKGLKKVLSKIITDSTPLEDPKDPTTCNVFAIAKNFLSHNQQEELAVRYQKGGEGYGHFKAYLHEVMVAYFESFWDKRQYYMDRPKEVYDIAHEGASQAKKLAKQKLDQIREATGLSY